MTPNPPISDKQQEPTKTPKDSVISKFFLYAAAATIALWLGMMLTHECGHMLAAMATGGSIQKLVFRPLAFSRTDVTPNPSPLFVAWAGPLFGGLAPLLILSILRLLNRRSHIAGLFSAFCLLANGAYLSFGSMDRIGDTAQILHGGSHPLTLWITGVIFLLTGLFLLHKLGPKFGMSKIQNTDICIACTAALLLLIISYSIGAAE